jgi:D-alanyl-D-alanine carboxypeptidase
LLFSYQGLEGLKTGYIRSSGFNLVAAARHGKKHVFVAFFGGKTAALRNAAVRIYLDAAFAKASEVKTRHPAPPVTAKAGTPPGGRGKGASVAMVSPPQLVKRASAPEAGAKTKTATQEAPPNRTDDDEDAPTVQSSVLLSAPKGAFHIQIGAFQTKAEAERQLASVRERAGTVLGAYAAYMSQIKRGEKTFFRARYVGFDAHDAAASVCSELKQMEIDCLVMKAE